MATADPSQNSFDDNFLFVFLQDEEWDGALDEVRRRPQNVREKVSVGKFYDSKISSIVNALHLACAKKNVPMELVESILKAHVTSPRETDSAYHRTPLHIAVMNNVSYKVVNALLHFYPQGAMKQDIHGRLPLHYAAKNVDGNGERSIRALLKAYPESTMVPDIHGFLPLHVACRMGLNMSLVRLLIRTAPLTIMAKTNKGSTPVHCAKLCNREPKLQKEILETLQNVAQETFHVVKERGYRSCSGSVAGTSLSSPQKSTSLDKLSCHWNIQKGLAMLKGRDGVPKKIYVSDDDASLSSNTTKEE